MASFRTRFRESRIVRTVGVYAASAWVVLEVVGTLRENLDLPRSLFVAALVLLSVGLVVVVATAWVQSRPGLAERASAEEVPEAWELDPRDLVRSLSRGQLPHLTWARALAGGLAALLILFGMAGLYIVVQDRGQSFLVRPAEAAAAPGIAVMPFSVSGDGVEVWREGMMDLLSTNLDGVGGLRTIHTRTVLARWRERGLDEGADLDQVLDVARSTGARLALVGSAVGVGSDVRLRAELYDLERGVSLSGAQVEGSQEGILTLVDRLSVDVVRRVLEEEGGSAVTVRSLESLTTPSLPALRAFLDGEVLYRSGDFVGAVGAFQAALREDSLFALAHHRLSSSLGWGGGSMAESDAHGRRARELADRLPPRDAAIIRLSDRALREDEAGALDDLRDLARRYPDDPEVWYWLGEAYNHTGELALVPVEDMGAAFETAIALDSTFVPAYIHAIESALSFHDMDRAASLVAGFERYGPGVDELERMRFMLRFTQSLDGIEVALDSTGDPELAFLVMNMDDASVGTERLRERLTEEVLRRLDAGREPLPPRFILLYRSDALLSGGQHQALRAFVSRLDPVDRAVDLLRASFQGVDALDASAIPSGDGVAALAYGAMVAARVGDRAAFDDRLAGLRAAQPPEGGDAEAFRAYVARAVQAVDAWGRWCFEGAEVGAPALEAAHQANREGGSPIMSLLLALAAESALTELGRPADALPYARSHRADPFATYRTARLYEELGQADEARRLYPLVLHAWDEADAEVREVEEARRRVGG